MTMTTTTTEHSALVTDIVNTMATDQDRTALAPIVEQILAHDAKVAASDDGQRIWQQDTFNETGQRLFQKLSKTSPALYAAIVQFADALVQDGIAAALLGNVTISEQTATNREGLFYSPRMGLYMVYGSTMMAPKVHQFATVMNDSWMERLDGAMAHIVEQLDTLSA